jgi:universal stress protein A
MLPITKIFCPTDFSEPSYKALKEANDLAMHFNAELILVHVLHPIIMYPAAIAAPGMMDAVTVDDVQREEIVKKSLEMTLKEKVNGSLKSRSLFAKGNAADEIVYHAKDEKVDLIVIGTHGFTGWRHLIMGSVAEKVVRLAHCPVLTIPVHDMKP